MNFRKLSLAAAIALLGTTSCVQDDAPESACSKCGCEVMSTDLTQHHPRFSEMFGRRFVGVARAPAGQEARGSCALDGETFVMTLEVGDVVDCKEPEDEREVSCAAATSGALTLEGSLQVGGAARAVTGAVGIRSCTTAVSMNVRLRIDGESDTTLTAIPSEGLSLDDRIESFSLDRRLSPIDAAMADWETCILAVRPE
jgi:hypothetical protein